MSNRLFYIYLRKSHSIQQVDRRFYLTTLLLLIIKIRINILIIRVSDVTFRIFQQFAHASLFSGLADTRPSFFLNSSDWLMVFFSSQSCCVSNFFSLDLLRSRKFTPGLSKPRLGSHYFIRDREKQSDSFHYKWIWLTHTAIVSPVVKSIFLYINAPFLLFQIRQKRRFVWR